MEEGLLGRSIKTQFQTNEEKIADLIEELKEINNQQQIMNGANFSNADIRTQKQKFKNKANTLKDLITSVEKVARGEQKGIINKHKQNYSREVERNKKILRSFVNQSFETRFSKLSVIKQSKAQGDFLANEQLQYFVDQKLINVAPPGQPVQNMEGSRVKTYSMEQGLQDEDVIDIENQLIDERQKELDQIEKEAIQLNMIAGQLAQEVDKQDPGLQAVQYNMSIVKDNVQQAGNELENASDTQQQTRKYQLCGLCIVLLLLAVISLVIVLIIRN
ncbi:Syntaxin-7 [Paramecium bursaria]